MYGEKPEDERFDVATIVSMTNASYNRMRDTLILLDPVTGQRKIEYRCHDIFTQQPTWLADTDINDHNNRVIYCPKESCGRKLGIYSLEGLKCKSCF
jgi:hypothetical protein